MAIPLSQLVAQLKAYPARNEFVKQFRKDIRKPVTPIRRAVKARAKAILPSGGGLGAWVARLSVTSKVYLGSKRARIQVKGSRKNATDKAWLTRIDAGSVRHPTWGRRGKDAWHTQSIPSGFWSDPLEEKDHWQKHVEDAVNRATEVLR